MKAIARFDVKQNVVDLMLQQIVTSSSMCDTMLNQPLDLLSSSY